VGGKNLSIYLAPGDAGTLKECKMVCESRPDCLQYMYAGGKCSTSTDIGLGREMKRSFVEYPIASRASACGGWIRVGLEVQFSPAA
jgi:hypothetical protein